MDAKTIGRKLAALRRGRSREVVAKAVGASPSAIAMYESGHRIPRDEMKIALASYFGVDVGALFYGSEVHSE